MRWSFARIIIYTIEVVLTIVGIFVGLRIILKLLGANAETPFVNWIYQTSSGLVAPFAGMFPSPVIEGGFIIEFSSIFALVVYSILGYLLIEMLEYVSYNSSRYRVVRTVVRE